MPVTTVHGPQLETILDDTYPVWGEGLSRQAYGAWNRAQMATDWGRHSLQRVALTEGNRVLASAKRYLFDARIAGVPARVLGVGAVFTPPALRGHGAARQLIEEMMAAAAADGCSHALLFSEIGPGYYEKLGFVIVPRRQYALRTAGKPGAPATFVRSGEAADLPAVAELTAVYAAGAGFALERSPELIQFAIARKRLLAGLGPAGMRHAEFFVAEEGYRAAAYVVVTRGPGGLTLQECGDRDPTGARVGAVLQVLAAREPAAGQIVLKGWLPDGFRPPQVRILEDTDASEVMMLRPLAGVASSSQGYSPVTYWQADVF
jgi:predicted N-acetyltransferase YhbS